jgi:CRISP-associated protein Cas1
MKIIDISRNNIHLSVFRGFLVLKENNKELKEPIADIGSIIVSGFGISYSHNLLARLCELNIPLIICGNNYMPAGYLISYCNNYKLAGRMQLQTEASLPLKKNVWKSIIKQKVLHQQIVLNNFSDPAKDFKYMFKRVKSGDSENIEAQAAAKYWQRLFGKDFRRDFEEPGKNAFLNFGYAIIRSCTARNIIGCGLSPALGLHHCNKLNAFCLADDLMEPYRQYVDVVVKQIDPAKSDELKPEYKKELSSILEMRVSAAEEKYSVAVCIQKTAQSLVNSFKTKGDMIFYPDFK